MKYIKKRYRIFYIPLIFLVYFFSSCKIVIQFITIGMIPEIDSQPIQISIEKINGKFYKVYIKGMSRFIGEELEVNEKMQNMPML